MATTGEPPLLRVAGLRTEFRPADNPVTAVDDVSFEIRPGHVLGIVGESGSGKSVTARSIMRMLRPPGTVTAGTVTYDGRDLLALPEREMRAWRGRKVAMVFQDPQAALNPTMRVGDQLVEAMTAHGRDRRAARGRARELLEAVGIPDVDTKADHYPHQFSGGMRQRVVIAIALANDPALLIADEPTTALDVTIQAQILDLLDRLRRELGIAVAIITHDMGVVAELCDDVVVMYAGRTVEKGSVAEVFSRPRHPYTAALLRAMPRIDDRRTGHPLAAIPGAPPDPSALPDGCAFAQRCQVAEAGCHTERPALTALGSGPHMTACFVAQRGDEVAPAASDTADTAVAAPGGADGPSAATPLLEVRDLRVDVGSRRRGLFGREPAVHAVDSVSLSVQAGKTLGLVGESGCGKSTLSRAIVGINQVAGGSVLVDGKDVSAMDEAALGAVRSSVQYLFQDPYASLNPRRTIRQSLAEALTLRGVRGRAQEDEARALMAQVGLRTDHLDRYPHAFSGGQRQRIGIARALARRPRALVLDEPVSALDVSVQAQIINLLAELQADLGLGYLFIAHDLSVVKHLSDTVAVMYLGRIVEHGPADLVYGRPQHPYTAALLSSSPAPEPVAGERERIVLRGELPSPAAPPTGCRFRTRCPIGPLVDPGRTACLEVDPSLVTTPNGQQAACHFPGELAGAGTRR